MMIQWTFTSNKEKYVPQNKFEGMEIELDTGEEVELVQRAIRDKKVEIDDNGDIRNVRVRSLRVRGNDLICNFGTSDRKDFPGVIKSISLSVEN